MFSSCGHGTGRHRRRKKSGRCLHLRCEICLFSRTMREKVSCLFCISNALCRTFRRYVSFVDGRSQKAGFASCRLLQLSLDTSSTFLSVSLSTTTTDKRPATRALIRRLVRQEMASASGTVFLGSFHDLDQVQERRPPPYPKLWAAGLFSPPFQHVTSASVKLEVRTVLISVLQIESTRG